MNIQEYQEKEILSKFGVSIPKAGIAYSHEKAKDREIKLLSPYIGIKLTDRFLSEKYFKMISEYSLIPVSEKRHWFLIEIK